MTSVHEETIKIHERPTHIACYELVFFFKQLPSFFGNIDNLSSGKYLINISSCYTWVTRDNQCGNSVLAIIGNTHEPVFLILNKPFI